MDIFNLTQFNLNLDLFKFSSVLDIIIITVLVYFVLLIVVRSKIYTIVTGLCIVAALYGISIAFNLPITKAILSYFFGVSLIFLAIIFQKEIKKFFEVIGLILRKKIQPLKNAYIKVMVDVLFDFSKQRTGAIIVLPGKESIDRHIEGGSLLEGKISESVIKSIFDTSSPGHDGALIFKDNKIYKFGVHLPLAESYDAVKRHGTRHRAALGLSEVSDALCLVVSEESGKISAIKQKQVTEIKTREQLEKIIADFFAKKFSRKINISVIRGYRREIVLFIIALFVSCIIWILFSGTNSTVQRQLYVPVEFKNMPSDLVVDKTTPQDIMITLNGTESNFSTLSDKQIKITIDAAGLKVGSQYVNITSKDLDDVSGFNLISITPKLLQVKIKKSGQ